MTLHEQQAEFTHDVGRLICFVFEVGYLCTLGDAYRDPEVAEIYYKKGKGIKDSLHCKRLAIDLNLFKLDGTYLDKTEDHAPFGKFWESLRMENRWGGNFKTRKDGNHYERVPQST